MKRYFGIALMCALCVALGLFVNGEAAKAEIVKSGTCGTNLTWTLDDAGLLTISGTGKMKNYGERCVDDSYITNAPWGLGIETVVIKSGVTSISDYAFEGCSSLTGVTIPESVTSIGDNVFKGCSSLASVTIPEGVTSISPFTFYNCDSLTSVTIPDSVTSIGAHAFEGCSRLKSITIPDSVTSIGYYAFTSWYSMKRYTNLNSDASKTLSKENYSFRVPGTNYNLKYLYTDDSITGLEISGVDEDATSITIPEGVTSIDDYAFSGCSGLTSITIPEGVTSIGNSAFSGCSGLTSITIPEGVTSIGKSAFSDCNSLTSITIPEGVTYIDDEAFEFCSSLTSITLPDSVTYIGEYVFEYCRSLTSITIPDGVDYIGDEMFFGCSSLTSITIPESVDYIGDDAFSGCSGLTSITLDSSDIDMFKEAFSGFTNITNVVLLDGSTSIGNYAFKNCSRLKSITIPDSVTSIGNYAFKNCSRLMRITIPDSVTSIGDGAFAYCDYLDRIVFLLVDETASISYSYKMFMGISPTVYCYMFTPVDVWASDRYTVKYLDEINMDTIRTITLPENFRLACGDSRTLRAVVFPEDHAPIAWSSSDPAVVQVADGTVTAVGAGTATVTATIGGVSSSVTIEVYIVATDFTLSESEAWVLAKQPIQLSVSAYEPAGAIATITWSSSDVALAKVDTNGLVTTILPGDVTITATSDNGISHECLIHLCYPVTAISFAAEPLRIGVGHSAQLTANVAMRSQSCVNHLVTFASDDEAVATVNAEGVVTAHASGTANIMATAANGVNASIAVTVIDCDIDGHEWGEASYAWSEDGRSATASRVCIYDDAHVETETVTASLALAKAPTDTEMGETLYTAAFDNAAFAQQTRTAEDIPALVDLRVLTLPAGLTAIKDEAFMDDDSIEAVIVPDGCQSIGSKAFANCPNLIYIRIPESVTNLAPDAFEGSNNVRIDRAGE